MTMPPGYRQRNADGSWSVWGHDWSIDLRIVDQPRSSREEPSDTLDHREPEHASFASGDGWRGVRQSELELDGSRVTHQLKATLVAGNSTLVLVACCAGRQGNERIESLLRSIVHRPSRSILGWLLGRR